MSERDPIVTLLRDLDGPVDPRPGFADALRARLLAELAQTNGAPARTGIRLPRRALPARLRRPLLAGALALAAAATVITAVVVSRPPSASALDVVRQARAAFAHVPPFQATYKVALNPDGSNPSGPRYVKKGATATLVLSFGGPHRSRIQILAEHGFTSGLAPGSYRIYTGRSPLEFLSWHGGYPDWERVCRGPYSRVFADARIAGRDARHIRCGNNRGYVWELWIDRQTGLLLKVVGQLDGGDFFLGGGISTSAKGGLEVEQLRYNPAFARGTFSAARGAFDAAAAARQATLAKLPPFRAVFAVYANGGAPGSISYVDEDWWLNEHNWRSKTLVADQHGCCGQDYTGAASFSVMAHGTQTAYNAHDHTFSSVDLGVGPDPAQELLDTYSPARCPIVGHARVAGRETDHRRCPRYVVKATTHGTTWGRSEYWIDAATGLTLRSQVNGHDLLVVRSIQYHPHFPPGIFRFVPPPGSHDLAQLENSPYYKTKLAPEKPAPNWHATTLAGRRFQLADLRGKPALLLLLPDWCPCNEFIPLSQLPPLEQAYRHSNGATTVIWVDAQGSTQAARTIARLNHLTFPVIVDKGAVEKAWAPQSMPKWVLLDPGGHVIEARLGDQTVAQLEQLLARG